MSIGKGHGSAVRVEVNPGPSLEVDPGPSLEVDPGPSLEVDPGPSLEVDLGPVLEVGPGIEQEPKVKAITMLTPRMSIPAPWTTTGNPQIGE